LLKGTGEGHVIYQNKKGRVVKLKSMVNNTLEATNGGGRGEKLTLRSMCGDHRRNCRQIGGRCSRGYIVDRIPI